MRLDELKLKADGRHRDSFYVVSLIAGVGVSMWLAVRVWSLYGAMEARYRELLKVLPLDEMVKLDAVVGQLRSVYVAASLLAVGLGGLAIFSRPRWPGILAVVCASCLAVFLASALV